MTSRKSKADFLLCVLLVAATLAVYWQVHDFGFVRLDDWSYVQSNPHVLVGLSADSVRWAFVTDCCANWHPVTWLSLMLDAQVGGGDPGVFHVTNVVLHVLNTLLLFALLNVMTGLRWRSAAVAVLFALHPLHVESVAWISERKDVLRTFFWLVTMLAYVRYARGPSPRRYLPVIVAFALGLMAKPMLVSLPIVLLLMDYWPLRRLGGGPRAASVPALIVEKIPLFALSAASCVATYWAQSAGGSVAASGALPLGVRVANALVSYVAYVGKMLCPLDLSPCYAHPLAGLPTWQVLGSGLLFVLALVVAVKARRKRPYLTVGWLWYVVTLVPVIGLVQVGQQSMADRYTYVPLIGLFVIMAWGLPEVLAGLKKADGERSRVGAIVPAVGVIALVGLAGSAYYQVGYWRDSISLFEHAVEVAPDSFLAHSGLGDAYGAAGRYEAAAAQYGISLKLRRGVTGTHYGLGIALMNLRKLPQAAAEFEYVLKATPDKPEVAGNLGVVFLLMGRVDDAIALLQRVIAASPSDVRAHNNLGCAYAGKGNHAAAAKEFKAALRLDPSNADARNNLAGLANEASGGSELRFSPADH